MSTIPAAIDTLPTPNPNALMFILFLPLRSVCSAPVSPLPVANRPTNILVT